MSGHVGAAHGDAAAVVDHRDRVVDVDGDVDLAAVAGQRLVDGVVDHLVDEVVQPGLAGGADVHGGADAHRLQALEDADGPRPVLSGGTVRGRRWSSVMIPLKCALGAVTRTGPPPPSTLKSRPRGASRSAQAGWAVVTRAWPRAATSGTERPARSSSSSESRSSRSATAAAPALLAVDLERGQGQGQQQAARLARRGRRWTASSPSIEQRDRVAVGPDEAAPRRDAPLALAPGEIAAASASRCAASPPAGLVGQADVVAPRRRAGSPWAERRAQARARSRRGGREARPPAPRSARSRRRGRDAAGSSAALRCASTRS